MSAHDGSHANARPTLRIGKAQWEGLRLHGEEAYPRECCGVLVGLIDANGCKQVTSAIRCRNTREDSPTNRFEIDARELLRIQRESRNTGSEIIGFYHSHPDHPARWSRTDLAEAHWTGCSYVITSVQNGCAVETTSFILDGEEETKSFQAEEIQIL
jgi:proteasome lid subunit RPN8/RPN11